MKGAPTVAASPECASGTYTSRFTETVQCLCPTQSEHQTAQKKKEKRTCAHVHHHHDRINIVAQHLRRLAIRPFIGAARQ